MSMTSDRADEAPSDDDGRKLAEKARRRVESIKQGRSSPKKTESPLISWLVFWPTFHDRSRHCCPSGVPTLLARYLLSRSSPVLLYMKQLEDATCAMMSGALRDPRFSRNARFFSYPAEVPKTIARNSPLFKPLLGSLGGQVGQGVGRLGMLRRHWECMSDGSREGVELTRHEANLFRYIRANWALSCVMRQLPREVMSVPPSHDPNDLRSNPYVEDWLCVMLQKVRGTGHRG